MQEKISLNKNEKTATKEVTKKKRKNKNQSHSLMTTAFLPLLMMRTESLSERREV